MPKAKKLRRKQLNNVVVVSDLHCGCGMGLIHKDGVKLDAGGHYKPSRLQLQVFDWWEEFWGDWIPKVTHGEPYAVVVNGDSIEGVHHKATTPISSNLEDQARVVFRILEPIVELCDGRFFMVRGTPAHVGPDAYDEEKVARHLRAKQNTDGQYARFDLWLRVGGEKGGLVHFNHHIGTTASSHHETSAINAELGMAFCEAGRWRDEPPDIVVRSHRHRCAEVRLPSRNGYAVSFVTAAWQLKTPFLYKVAGGRMTLPQIGGSLIRMGDEELHTRHWVQDVQRDKVEVMDL